MLHWTSNNRNRQRIWFRPCTLAKYESGWAKRLPMPAHSLHSLLYTAVSVHHYNNILHPPVFLPIVNYFLLQVCFAGACSPDTQRSRTAIRNQGLMDTSLFPGSVRSPFYLLVPSLKNGHWADEYVQCTTAPIDRNSWTLQLHAVYRSVEINRCVDTWHTALCSFSISLGCACYWWLVDGTNYLSNVPLG